MLVLAIFYLGCLSHSLAQETILYPSIVEDNMWFGTAVEILNSNEIAVGARYGDPDLLNTGSIFVFRKEEGSWIEDVILIPSDINDQEFFGNSFSGFGNYLLIGASGDEENGDRSGAAYIFKKNNGEWIEQVKLMPSTHLEFQRFGSDVSIYGTYALIGSSGDTINNLSSSGSAYIFKRDGDSWIEEAKLIPSDPTTDAGFGRHVSLFNDYAFIGATLAYQDSIKTGAVYVFKKNGNDWIEQAKLIPDDAAHLDWFGINITAQENSVLIGTANAGNSQYARGAAYLFHKELEDWDQEMKFVPQDESEIDKMGWGAHYSGDYAIVCNSDNSFAATAYLFRKNGVAWSELLTLTGPESDQFDRFGSSVFLKDQLLAIGAWGQLYQGSESIRTGAVYIYDLDLLSSTEEIYSFDENVRIFPNPTKDKLSIWIDNIDETTINRLEVYDINGKLILNATKEIILSNSSFDLDTSNFNSGMYFIKIYSGKRMYQGRFIRI